MSSIILSMALLFGNSMNFDTILWCGTPNSPHKNPTTMTENLEYLVIDNGSFVLIYDGETDEYLIP